MLATVDTFRAARKAVKMLIWMACWRADLACLMHSLKWASSCCRCFWATEGKALPKRAMEESITATPRGRGPGRLVPWGLTVQSIEAVTNG